MIYIDSCLLIYANEDTGLLGERARALLSAREGDYAISPLVVTEASVWPLRVGDQPLLTKYQSSFDAFTMLDIEFDSYLRAAELRAATAGLKTADALHLAVAQQSGCTALWTNDRRLAAASGAFSVDVIGAT